MERIYHNYEKWECYKSGFFGYEIKDKNYLINKVVELFSNPKETEKYMDMVIKNWHCSCEHNLTNTSMNRVAWLGQSACCLYAKVPFNITMEAWNLVPQDFQNQANKIAEIIIEKYEHEKIS
jgi:hypothetical protein